VKFKLSSLALDMDFALVSLCLWAISVPMGYIMGYK